MSTTNTQTIISQLTDAELCLLEQLTYLDEDVAKTAFGKDNYDDLDFYKINKMHKDKTISQILSTFNETAIANLRMHPEEICDAAISGMEWASIIEQLKSNENLKNLVLSDILLDESGYHTVTDATRYEYPYPLALCFTDDSDSPSDAVIAYKGTTGETEWADNVGGAYKAKTDPQKVALDFAVKMGIKYSDITVTGHSKGANKAMFVSIFASSVTRCVCFDGQGFSSEFYKDSTVWKRIRERTSIITNYALSSDFVHILLNQIPGSNQYYCEGYGVDSIMENYSPNSFLKQTDWNSMNLSKSNLEHYWNLINRVLEYEKIVDDNSLNVIEALYDLYPKYDFFTVYDLSYVEQHTYAKELTQIFRESVVNQIPDSSLGSLIGLSMNLIDEDAELAALHEFASSLVAIGDQDMLEYIIENFIGTMILTYHNDGTEITKNEKFNSLFADSEMLAKIVGRTLYYMNRMDNLNLDYINNLLEAFHAEPIVGLLGWVIQKVDDSLIDNIFGGEDDWALKSLAWASAKKV